MAYKLSFAGSYSVGIGKSLELFVGSDILSNHCAVKGIGAKNGVYFRCEFFS